MVFNDHSSLIDPWKQPLDLVQPDGSHFALSMEDINMFRKYTASLGINYGSQIGASLLLLLVLLLLTRADKRKSKIFIINVLCLVCNSIRCILLSVYLTGTLWHPYSQAIGDFSRISGRDLANTTAANVFWMIVMILVMTSLTVQVWTVCVTTVPKQRYIIVAVTGLMGLAATIMKAVVIILTIIQLHKRQTMERYLYLHSHAYVLQGVSIWLYSLVFTYKLGYAIVQRRRLNMTQFGPMQVIFIGGCQTMLVPAIFTCFQFREDVPELGAQVLTVVCIFLPLSAIWAGVVNETIPASRAADSHHKLIRDQFYRVSTKSGASSHPSSNNNNSPEKSRQLSVCTCCASKTNATDSSEITPTTRRTGRDMYGEDSILIDREFGFTKEDAGDRV